jgi:hypothetical protein
MTEPLTCANHPTRETMLRCNRCEKPICTSCAVHTPTGYRCKECVNEQKKKFETAEWYDYLVGVLTSAGLSLIASGLIALLSFFIGFFIWFIAAGVAGGAANLIARIIKRFLGGRRSRTLFALSTAGVILGALPPTLFFLFTGSFYPLIGQGIYLFVAVPAVYYYLSGFRL